MITSGDWKLGALDFACNLAQSDDRKFFLENFSVLQDSLIPPERKQMSKLTSPDNIDATLISHQWSADIYCLGTILMSSFDLIAFEVPTNVTKYIDKMLHNDPKRRPTASQLLKYPIFNTEHIQLLASLGELSIRAPTESIETLGKISSRFLLHYGPSVTAIALTPCAGFKKFLVRFVCIKSCQVSTDDTHIHSPPSQLTIFA